MNTKQYNAMRRHESNLKMLSIGTLQSLADSTETNKAKLVIAAMCKEFGQDQWQEMKLRELGYYD